MAKELDFLRDQITSRVAEIEGIGLDKFTEICEAIAEAFNDIKPQTMGEELRTMSDEKLAGFLALNGCPMGECDIVNGASFEDCKMCLRLWLKREVKNERF